MPTLYTDANNSQFLKTLDRYSLPIGMFTFKTFPIIRYRSIFDSKNGLESTIKLMHYVFSSPDNLCVTNLLSFKGLSPMKGAPAGI